jgi:hypothetical protein
MVEVGWRYAPEVYAGFNSRTAKTVRVNLSSLQAGAVLKYTFDGTDPSLTNGKVTDTDIDPGNAQTYTPCVPYIIARAFKDGCCSAPVYVPVDIVCPQTTGVNARGVTGTGSASAGCPVWIHDEHGEKVIWVPGFWSNWPDVWPCSADLGALIIGAVGQAAGGASIADHGLVLSNWLIDGPNFMTRPAFDLPYGPEDLNDMAKPFGGGTWICTATNIWTSYFQYSHDGSTFLVKPSDDDAFYLLSGLIKKWPDTINGETQISHIVFPNVQDTRKRALELYGASGTGNTLPDRLLDSMPYDVLRAPGNSIPRHDLERLEVCITCAFE